MPQYILKNLWADLMIKNTASNQLEKKVAAYIECRQLLKARQAVLVAVSGGLDSMTLLFVLQRLGYQVTAAHFDHQLRGEESSADAVFVADYCHRHDIPLAAGTMNILKLAQGANLEDTARFYRYQFLRQESRLAGGIPIATAHHLRDQAETVLLHLLRGAGGRGMCGMLPANSGVIRPFLAVEKEEIKQYALAHNIVWREDSSNQDTGYTRNRLRLELWPQLLSYNPKLESAVGVMAELMQEDDALLQELAEQRLSVLYQNECLDYPALLAEPLALRRRVIRLFYQQRTGGTLDAGRTAALLSMRSGQSVSLPQGLYAVLRGTLLCLEFCPLRLGGEADFCLPQPVPGCAFLPLSKHMAVASLALAQGQSLPENGYTLILPISYANDLVWRPRREGDVLKPRGFKGHQKVKKIMQNSAIPADKRKVWPLLYTGEDLLWIPGCRMGEAANSFKGQAVKIDLKNYLH